jgi:hypothetical protein
MTDIQASNSLNPLLGLGSLTLDVDELKGVVDGLSLADLLEGIHSPGFPERKGHYTYTHSGRLFFPCDPRPEEVFIKDIATAASRICRFNGQTERYLSVAEHLWHASHRVPREIALETLLHDCAEPYIGDMIRPLKVLPFLGQVYLKIEKGIETAIAARYGLAYPWSREIMRADEEVLHVEIAHNIRSKVDGVHFNKAVYDRDTEKLAPIKLWHWSEPLAATMFLARFDELARERGIDLGSA